MTVADRVRDLVLPLLAERDIELYDLEVAGPVLKVVVDRPGGLDLDVLAKATRAVSHALDEADPIAGAYTLEVTSPGLDRALPGHEQREEGSHDMSEHAVRANHGHSAFPAAQRRALIGGSEVRS